MSKQVFLFFIAGLMGLAACSSLKKQIVNAYLSDLQEEKAKNVNFNPPPAPYRKESHPSLDALYWNPETSSSISYFSSCGQVPTSLSEFQRSAFPKEEGSFKVKTQVFKNHLYSTLEISHSGSAKTHSAVHSFKKGDCLFNLNLVSSSLETFEAEEPLFKSFIKHFKAQ